MLASLLVVFTAIVLQATPAVALPDTPQGKRVQAFIDAFNTSDEKKYLAMQEAHFEPALLKARSVEERTAMFKRMRGDFGTMKVTRVARASAAEIVLVVPNAEGNNTSFTFRFESAKPFRISSVQIEAEAGLL